MYFAEEFSSEKIFLAPFNVNSVLCFHKLKATGVSVSRWMDKNEFLQRKTYQSVQISQYYYDPEAVVILCFAEEKSEYIDQLLSIGYSSENIIQYKDILFKDSDYSIAQYVDIQSLDKINPFWRERLGLNSILRIKKLQRFHELQNELQNFSLSTGEFEGFQGKDCFRDDNGNPHIILQRMEIIVTSRCSLQCKNCAAWIPYYHKQSDLQSAEIIKDFHRLMQLVEWVDNLVIIGGEPFLFKDLNVVIDAIEQDAEAEKKVGIVTIVTNGTVVPSNEVLESFSKSKKVLVEISNYDFLSSKLEELITKLNEYQIKYEVLPKTSWSNVMQFVSDPLPDAKDYLLQKRQVGCVTKCRTVSKGKFYLCSALKSFFEAEIVKADKNDYVDIYATDAKELMCQYLSRSNPLPSSCNYCNGCSEADWNRGGYSSSYSERG